MDPMGRLCSIREKWVYFPNVLPKSPQIFHSFFYLISEPRWIVGQNLDDLDDV